MEQDFYREVYEDGDDYIVEVCSADEHTALVTRRGRVFTVGSN